MTDKMVLKTISQETFDAVVLENMEEFDMDTEEALTEATEQFKCQGVNMNIIIKEVPIQDGRHKVVYLLQSLAQISNQEDWNEATMRPIFCDLSKELSQDLSKRYQACKIADASNIIFQACVLSMKKECCKIESFRAFCSLVTGQPDEATNERLQFFVGALRECQEADIVEVTTRILKYATTMQENNKQFLVKFGIIELLLHTMETFIENLHVVRECCETLRALTLDDDIRVPFGKAHDHAKMIVTDHDGLQRLVAVLKEHRSELSLVKEISSTLSKLMVHNEFCQQFVDTGGFAVLRDIVDAHYAHAAVVRQCVNLIEAISGNDDVKIYLVKNGCVEILLNILYKYIANSPICESCFAALTTLSLRNPAHCKMITDKKMAPTIIQAMTIHTKYVGVQKQACRLIRNLVARNREHSSQFLELGAEELIRQARKQHSEGLDDEAKAALRDLDLEVDLKQLWTGCKPGMAR